MLDLARVCIIHPAPLETVMYNETHGATNWHVLFTTHGGYAETLRLPSAAHAIEAACQLLEEGYDVSGIGPGPLTEAIDRAEIDRIQALWKSLRPHRSGPGVA